jgi:hypothetical protein
VAKIFIVVLRSSVAITIAATTTATRPISTSRRTITLAAWRTGSGTSRCGRLLPRRRRVAVVHDLGNADRSYRRGRRRRLKIHFRIKDYALHPTKESTLLNHDGVLHLVSFDTEGLRCVLQRLFQIATFEPLTHNDLSLQARCRSSGCSFHHLFMMSCCVMVRMFWTSQ